MEQYFDFKERCGLEYLRLTLPGDTWMQEQMAMERSYWGWWKVMLYARESDFLLLAEVAGDNIHQARWRYRQMHNPSFLADGRTEPGRQMEASYGRDYITDLVKEKTKRGDNNNNKM